MAESQHLSVADVAGAWVEPDLDSGLVRRCREYWNTPVDQLPDVLLLTFMNQRIATDLVKTEVRRRIASGIRDDSELYEGQLARALAACDADSTDRDR
ncbi:MAG: hypothetical protein WD069_12345 [Planctomycetales bacterium]